MLNKISYILSSDRYINLIFHMIHAMNIIQNTIEEIVQNEFVNC